MLSKVALPEMLILVCKTHNLIRQYSVPLPKKISLN